MLQQLQTGALDFGFLTLGEFTNRDESYGALLAPYLVRDAGAAADLLQGRVAGRLLEGTARFGLQGLAWGMAGMRQVVMKGDVAGAEDLRGKKIRTVPLAQELDFWTRVGATPTPMPLGDVYPALTQGVIDGVENPLTVLHGQKLDEQAKQLSMVGYVTSAAFWLSEHPEFPDQEFAALLQPTEWPALLGEYLPEPEPSPQLCFDFALTRSPASAQRWQPGQ